MVNVWLSVLTSDLWSDLACLQISSTSAFEGKLTSNSLIWLSDDQPSCRVEPVCGLIGNSDVQRWQKLSASVIPSLGDRPLTINDLAWRYFVTCVDELNVLSHMSHVYAFSEWLCGCHDAYVDWHHYHQLNVISLKKNAHNHNNCDISILSIICYVAVQLTVLGVSERTVLNTIWILDISRYDSTKFSWVLRRSIINFWARTTAFNSDTDFCNWFSVGDSRFTTDELTEWEPGWELARAWVV